MRKIGLLIAIAFVATIIAGNALAKDIPLYGKDAEIHRIVSASPSGVVQVPSHYDKAIKVKKLSKDETAYWNPDGGKYITAGEYAFVWAKVVKGKSGSSHYHWVAVNTQSLYKALDLMKRFAHGVAFYSITRQDKQVILEAVPYDTIHAIAEGKKAIGVNE